MHLPAAQAARALAARLDLRSLCCRRGYCSLPCPSAASCQACRSNTLLLPPVSRQAPAEGCVCVLFSYFGGRRDKKSESWRK